MSPAATRRITSKGTKVRVKRTKASTKRTKWSQRSKVSRRISRKHVKRTEKKRQPILTQDEWERLIELNQTMLSVIITASNEAETIGALLTNIKELQPKEMIVVENGSTDQTGDICLQHGIKLISYPYRLGHDVGRAVGAKQATGEILLFLDGDMVLTPAELWPFLHACYNGADIALNNLNRFYVDTSMVDAVSMAKAFLNQLLLKPQLRYSSLTAIPHAMRRKAAEMIGFEHLLCPPKAQAIAILKGLDVQQVDGPNVIRKNKIRPYNAKENNQVEELILGDHIEAIQLVQKWTKERVFFPDTIRLRELLKLLPLHFDSARELLRK